MPSYSIKQSAWLFLCSLFLLGNVTLAHAANIDESYWPVIKAAFFSDQQIKDGSDFIAIQAPITAEDASIVPITFTLNQMRKTELNISKVYLFVDANPIQLTATFHYYQKQQPIQVATRIRLEKNTFVRVIAESEDGHYFMHKVAIKTPGGGCGGGASGDEAKLRAEAGKMKLLLSQHKDANTTQLTSAEDSATFSHHIRFNIKHPMRTGFERTTQGYYAKAYHIKRLDFSSASVPILSIDVGVGISADPFFDFAVSHTLEQGVQVKALDNEAKMYDQSF